MAVWLGEIEEQKCALSSELLRALSLIKLCDEAYALCDRYIRCAILFP